MSGSDSDEDFVSADEGEEEDAVLDSALQRQSLDTLENINKEEDITTDAAVEEVICRTSSVEVSHEPDNTKASEVDEREIISEISDHADVDDKGKEVTLVPKDEKSVDCPDVQETEAGKIDNEVLQGETFMENSIETLSGSEERLSNACSEERTVNQTNAGICNEEILDTSSENSRTLPQDEETINDSCEVQEVKGDSIVSENIESSTCEQMLETQSTENLDLQVNLESNDNIVLGKVNKEEKEKGNMKNEKCKDEINNEITLENKAGSISDETVIVEVDGNQELTDSTLVESTKEIDTVAEKEVNDSLAVTEIQNENIDTDSAAKQDDWGWDSWADDFIHQATSKVSSLLETVEGQLGIPDPMQMAQVVKNEETEETELKKGKEGSQQEMSADETGNISKEEDRNMLAQSQSAEQNSGGVSSWFSSFVPVSSITNLVQSTGQDLVSGSIDALEFIGKKTVNMLSEGDPGLRNKRDNLLGNKSSSLSAILQEAKTKAEQEERSIGAIKGENPAKFNDMFDKFQGVAHLDALKMLSNECENKLERILNVQSDEAKDESMEILSAVKNNFDLEEEQEADAESKDFKKEIYLATKKLRIKVTCSKLLNSWSKLKEKTRDLSGLENANDCFENAVSSLAELTSRFIEYYRKVADMLIMTDMQAKELATDRASGLKLITELFQMEVSSLANSYANDLVENKNESASDLITDIYLESSNCFSLLQDSHGLLLPILQCSVVK